MVPGSPAQCVTQGSHCLFSTANFFLDLSREWLGARLGEGCHLLAVYDIASLACIPSAQQRQGLVEQRLPLTCPNLRQYEHTTEKLEVASDVSPEHHAQPSNQYVAVQRHTGTLQTVNTPMWYRGGLMAQ